MIKNFVNQFSYESHPIIEILTKVSEHRSQIINKLIEYNTNSEKEEDLEYDNSIRSVWCDLVNFIGQIKSLFSDKDLIEKLEQFILTKFPLPFQNKVKVILNSGGILNLEKWAQMYCKSNSETMALILMDLTNVLNKPENTNYYQKQYLLFSFIDWIDSVVRNGLNYQSNHSVVKDSMLEVSKILIIKPFL